MQLCVIRFAFGSVETIISDSYARRNLKLLTTSALRSEGTDRLLIKGARRAISLNTKVYKAKFNLVEVSVNVKKFY